MGKVVNTINTLFKKVEETEQRYVKALENKEEALIVLQAEMQEKEKQVVEMQKMKLLGDITEETFDKMNSEYKKLQDKYEEGKHEIDLIQKYQHEDAVIILAELKEAQKEHSPLELKEIHEMQMELLDAKHTYLKKMTEMRVRYYKTVAPKNRIKQMEYKLGLKKGVYTSDSYEALHQFSVSGRGYINLEIDNGDVHDALYSGRFDSQLTKVVSEAKE